MFLLSSCHTISIHHGYPASEVNLWNNVKVGDLSSQVIQLIGDPCIIEENVWYYVSYSIYKKRFFSTKEYESLVLKITFDSQANKVTDIQNIKVDRKSLVKLLKKNTPVTGIHDSLLRQFSNKLQ
ncbi:smpA / OmlA family protein [Ehrlichia chaffeensis str. Liberty]|nr:smpA / OmlA family protein [Ehrlichia chaffeensis str. Jax]AHX06563.1 smpA / OmlA family protein [Ehrlichia chaffeensis str. Liberty]AHX07309.1 smpA / OmlA family protein [Ehrlichia chaffeensis str. Osceola]AHX09595.1 smpA / OmlA family protein [Ehrlichia chaffeensis str. Wakulla]